MAGEIEIKDLPLVSSLKDNDNLIGRDSADDTDKRITGLQIKNYINAIEKSSIKQTTGTSTVDIMSQKSITDELEKINDITDLGILNLTDLDNVDLEDGIYKYYTNTTINGKKCRITGLLMISSSMLTDEYGEPNGAGVVIKTQKRIEHKYSYTRYYNHIHTRWEPWRRDGFSLLRETSGGNSSSNGYKRIYIEPTASVTPHSPEDDVILDVRGKTMIRSLGIGTDPLHDSDGLHVSGNVNFNNKRYPSDSLSFGISNYNKINLRSKESILLRSNYADSYIKNTGSSIELNGTNGRISIKGSSGLEIKPTYFQYYWHVRIYSTEANKFTIYQDDKFNEHNQWRLQQQFSRNSKVSYNSHTYTIVNYVFDSTNRRATFTLDRNWVIPPPANSYPSIYCYLPKGKYDTRIVSGLSVKGGLTIGSWVDPLLGERNGKPTKYVLRVRNGGALIDERIKIKSNGYIPKLDFEVTKTSTNNYSSVAQICLKGDPIIKMTTDLRKFCKSSESLSWIEYPGQNGGIVVNGTLVAQSFLEVFPTIRTNVFDLTTDATLDDIVHSFGNGIKTKGGIGVLIQMLDMGVLRQHIIYDYPGNNRYNKYNGTQTNPDYANGIPVTMQRWQDVTYKYYGLVAMWTNFEEQQIYSRRVVLRRPQNNANILEIISVDTMVK